MLEIEEYDFTKCICYPQTTAEKSLSCCVNCIIGFLFMEFCTNQFVLAILALFSHVYTHVH